MSLLIEEVAKIGYEVIREYKAKTNIANTPPWHELSIQAQMDSVCHIKIILANPSITAMDVHQVWLNAMTATGWQYAELTDMPNKKHSFLLECDKLTNSKDIDRVHSLFKATVLALAPLMDKRPAQVFSAN